MDWKQGIDAGPPHVAHGDFPFLRCSTNTFPIRRHVADVAERLERELGEEPFYFIDGWQLGWGQLPPPDDPLTVGIDGD
jgi:hypothetical protein